MFSILRLNTVAFINKHKTTMFVFWLCVILAWMWFTAVNFMHYFVSLYPTRLIYSTTETIWFLLGLAAIFTLYLPVTLGWSFILLPIVHTTAVLILSLSMPLDAAVHAVTIVLAYSFGVVAGLLALLFLAA